MLQSNIPSSKRASSNARAHERGSPLGEKLHKGEIGLATRETGWKFSRSSIVICWLSGGGGQVLVARCVATRPAGGAREPFALPFCVDFLFQCLWVMSKRVRIHLCGHAQCSVGGLKGRGRVLVFRCLPASYRRLALSIT